METAFMIVLMMCMVGLTVDLMLVLEALWRWIARRP